MLGVLLSLRVKEVDYVRSALARSKQKSDKNRETSEKYMQASMHAHTHTQIRTHTLWQRTACQNAKETTL